MQCFVAWFVLFPLMTETQQRARVWTRGRQWVVSARAINIHLFCLGLRRILFSFTVRWRWLELRSFLKWNCFGRFFHIGTKKTKTFFTTRNDFCLSNKDIAKMRLNALMLIVSLLDILTHGKLCHLITFKMKKITVRIKLKNISNAM